ncbi:MAG: hypothetical protein OEL78_01225 [Hyphomicrobiales bacterium]|nr:hypothetical protein [Hyphomicrobiales bacterium]
MPESIRPHGLDKLRSFLAAALLFPLALSSPASAVVVTSGCAGATSCTLTELFAGGTITVDDVLFDSFVFGGSAGNVALSSDFVTVTGVAGAGITSLDFLFDPALAAGVVGDFLEDVFDFDATVVASLRTIESATLAFDDAGIAGDAFIQVGTVIGGTVLEILIDSISADILSDTEALASLTTLSAAVDYQGEVFDVDSSFFLGAYSFDLTLAGVNPVPLPAALPLFGAGLGMLGFLGWKRRRKA